MFMIKKAILVVLIIIGKIIALPAIVLLEGIVLLTNSCGKVAKLIMGIFNFLMGIMFFYFIGTHNMDMLKNELYLFIIEAFGVTLCVLAQGVLDFAMAFFKELLLFSPFSKAKN